MVKADMSKHLRILNDSQQFQKLLWFLKYKNLSNVWQESKPTFKMFMK